MLRPMPGSVETEATGLENSTAELFLLERKRDKGIIAIADFSEASEHEHGIVVARQLLLGL